MVKKAKDASKTKANAGKKGAVAEPTRAAAGQAVHLISEAMLVKLLKADRSKRADIDGLVGELREMIGNAKEKHHLHTGVYGWIKKLHKMEAEKAAEWHDTYMAYLDMSGVMKKIESVEALPFGNEPPEDEKIEAETETGNVTRPQFGGQQVAAAE